MMKLMLTVILVASVAGQALANERNWRRHHDQDPYSQQHYTWPGGSGFDCPENRMSC